MSEPVDDPRLGRVVGRHLHFHPVANGKANKTFAHLAGNMREHEMIIRKCDAKHGARKHRHDGALQCNGFFGIHDVNVRVGLANSAAQRFSGRAAQSIPVYRRKPANERRGPEGRGRS